MCARVDKSTEKKVFARQERDLFDIVFIHVKTHFNGVPVGGEDEAFVTALSALAIEASFPSSAVDGGGGSGGTAVKAAAVAGCGGVEC